METEVVIDSDTSSELPDLFTRKPFVIDKLEPNEIVWAEYKGLHWPALVRHVDKKNKKVRVWYLDEPKKTFKVPYQKIHDFSDPEFNKEVNEKAKSNPDAQKHYEVCRRSLIFLMRKDRGLEDNPADFFDKSKHYFVTKAFYSQNPDFNLDSEDASTERIDGNVENSEKSSEGESLAESDEESFQKRKISADLYKEDRLYTDEMEEKFCQFIKDGYVDNHLMKIWTSTVASERHDLYLEALNVQNLKLLTDRPPYIPLSNRDILQNINLYLYELYERNIGIDKPKMNEYIVSVWLPEAIDKAISLMNSGSLQDIGKLNSCSLSDLPEPTLRLPVSPNKDKAYLANEAQTSKSLIQNMNKVSKSLVSEMNTLKAKTKSFKRSFPYGAPPAVQALTDKVDGLEASIQNLQSHVVKERRLICGSDSSDDSTGNDIPAIKNTRRKRQKKSLESAPRRTSRRLQLKK